MRFTSFIVIPDRSSRNFTVRIPNAVLVVLGAGFCLGLCVIIVLGLFYNRLYQEATRAEMLARDNRELRREVEKIRELDRQIREMRSLDIRIRQLMGQEIEPSLYGLLPEQGGGVATVEAVEESLARAIGLGGASRESIPSIWPLAGTGFISKSYSPESPGESVGHGGVDISVKTGTPVLGAADGRVVFTGSNGNWGLKIEIDHGNGLSTVYVHLSKSNVKVDMAVEKGDTIGLSGDSGRSTAPHLHYEVRFNGSAIDPERFLAAPGG